MSSMSLFGQLYHLDTVDSTNEEALRLIRSGISSGIVIADRQTAGRGRNGRTWESPRGAGVYVSFFTSSSRLPSSRVVPPAVALAASETIQHFVHDTVSVVVKWPNDVLVAGKKAAGVLCGRHVHERDVFTVIGVGINLQSPPADRCRWPPVGITDHCDIPAGISAVTRVLTADFQRTLELEESEILERFFHRVRWMNGREIRCTDGKQRRCVGTVIGFSGDGTALVIEDETGQKRTLYTVSIADVTPMPE